MDPTKKDEPQYNTYPLPDQPNVEQNTGGPIPNFQSSNQPFQQNPQPQFNPQDQQPYSNDYYQTQRQNSQTYQPDVTSAEYLDQIARPAKAKGPGNMLLAAVAGIGVVSVILFGFLMFNQQPSKTEKLTDLYLRLQTLQIVADEESSRLKDTDLQAKNSSLSLLLTNSLRDVKQPILSSGVKEKALSEKASPTDVKYREDLLAKFEDARLNVQLDSTYARQMSYELTIVRSMMVSIYKSTKNDTIKKTLETTDSNLMPIQEEFSKFSGAKE